MGNRSLKSARIVRWCVLAASVVFFLFLSSFISVHAICPIGGFELFFTGLLSGGFSVAGLFSGMLLTFLLMSILSIVFRRAYCGYICPLGAAQEIFERVGKLVLPRRLSEARIPPKADRGLRWLKYAVLASFVAGAAIWGGHWMIEGDPFIVFMSLGDVGGIGATIRSLPFASAFLAAILLFAFFLGRGFCKYLCPAGAWYAILSKLSPNKVVRNEGACLGCGLCSAACPMGIDVAHLNKVSSAECIGCRECLNACPAKGALSAPLGALEAPPAALPLAAAAVFAGSVGLSAAAMPAWGGHGGPGGSPGGEGSPDVKSRQGGGGGPAQDGSWKNGDQKGREAGKVGFGGCPSCNGCGFCVAALRS